MKAASLHGGKTQEQVHPAGVRWACVTPTANGARWERRRARGTPSGIVRDGVRVRVRAPTRVWVCARVRPD